ncbi:MAG: ABC transporter permease [Alphaproteobacteria bacterium]|nr:ABC transporter permease [Alphaproteobacteria bacterium]
MNKHNEYLPNLNINKVDDQIYLTVTGDWIVQKINILEKILKHFLNDNIASEKIYFDMANINRLDSVGAWLLQKTIYTYQSKNINSEFINIPNEYLGLIKRVQAIKSFHLAIPFSLNFYNFFIYVISKLGFFSFAFYYQTLHWIAFLGAVILALARLTIRRDRRRWIALIGHLQHVGLYAMPIVGLLSILIGVVLTFQAVDQLKRFGTEIFTVNLVAISVLREMGVLVTAVVVAGRSGSAFTAQIGAMVVNDEVDALRSLGLDPIEVLVRPRLIALLIALPLLTFYSNFMAILGGAMMSWLVIDLPPSQFFSILQNAVPYTTFWLGLIKAPFFAFFIALIGCFEGLRVERDAEGVGHSTTRSVVEGIFMVIALDAIFSIVFSFMGI